DTVDAYTHRIGRTGRAERSGDAYSFAVPDDAAIVRQIERLLKVPLERKRLPDFDYGGFVPETAVSSTSNSKPNQHHSRSRNNGRSRNNRNGQPRKRKSYSKTR
ncbi:MAG: ATP-dependent helicase, partial [Chloroflexi bacterium]|nr:ATP-dependent helicase [Chloroflexota bacterium]